MVLSNYLTFKLLTVVYMEECKILSWNVKGLRNIKSRASLRRMINNLSPNVICLQETKLKMVDNSFLRGLKQDARLRGVFMGSRGLVRD